VAALERAPRPLPAFDLAGTTDEDAHLSLYLCYELHYQGFPEVDERWEWEPSLVGLTGALEEWFQASLVERTAPACVRRDGCGVAQALRELVAADDGPSLSAYMAERGSLDEMREFAIHRSAYQLKEADPHTWAIPRLTGRAKAALVAIQADEYGNGAPLAIHSALFADTLRALDLDPRYGAHLDRIPATTLATVNLISMLGLHRRWRGAILGHLAVFEMTSVVPMGRYSAALRRLGVPECGRRFYDVHVEADVLHEKIALDEMVDGFAAAEPHLGDQVLFGARALMRTEADFAGHLLESWADGRSSLRRP
jgi:hypothetical protein